MVQQCLCILVLRWPCVLKSPHKAPACRTDALCFIAGARLNLPMSHACCPDPLHALHPPVSILPSSPLLCPRWRLFGDVSQERQVACQALCWLRSVIVCCSATPAGTAQGGAAADAALLGVATGAGAGVGGGGGAVACELLLFPRYHLDMTSLLCRCGTGRGQRVRAREGGRLLWKRVLLMRMRRCSFMAGWCACTCA